METGISDGSETGVAFAAFDDELAMDMPAFLAAANRGAGIDFATAAFGAAACDAADGSECTGDDCIREATADFAMLLDISCFEDDGSTEEPASSSSFASRKASASFFFFLEALDAAEAEDALGAWLTGIAEAGLGRRGGGAARKNEHDQARDGN